MSLATTIRWDSEDKKKEVERLARESGQSVNHMINRWAEIVTAQRQAEAAFRASARLGDRKRLLARLKKLDEEDRAAGIANTRP